MYIKQKYLLAFLFANVALFFLNPLFPQLRLFFYAPLLVFFLIHASFFNALWIAFGLGIFLDLLSSAHMGINACNFLLTSFILYPQRKHFFKDNPYNLSLFTVLFSLLSTFLYALLIFLFDRRNLFSGKWILTDIFFMPLMDGVYAYVWFTLPLALWEKIRKREVNEA